MSISSKTCLEGLALRCLILPPLLAAAYAANVTIRRADSGQVAIAVDAAGATSSATPDYKLAVGPIVRSSNEGHFSAPPAKSVAPTKTIQQHVQIVVNALGETTPSDPSMAGTDGLVVSHSSIIRQSRQGSRPDNSLGPVDELGLPLDVTNSHTESVPKSGTHDVRNLPPGGGFALEHVPRYFSDVMQHLTKAQIPFTTPVVPSGSFGLQLPRRSIQMAVCFAWVAGGLFMLGYWLRCLLMPATPIAFYGNPVAKEPDQAQRQITCDSKECEAFIGTFNAVPEKVQLRISGHRRDDQKGVGRYVHWFWCSRRGKQADVAFTAYLDLKLFIGDGIISREDLSAVRSFLETENPLETLTIRKDIKWDGLPEVTKCIRDRLRELGFSGAVDVAVEGNDRVSIHHNHPWTNFIHSPVTAVLACCSILGGFVLYPYMWARRRRTSIHSIFRVNVHAKDYWELVEVGIDAQHGFVLR